jgi:hypothetical protein
VRTMRCYLENIQLYYSDAGLSTREQNTSEVILQIP